MALELMLELEWEWKRGMLRLEQTQAQENWQGALASVFVETLEVVEPVAKEAHMHQAH